MAIDQRRSERRKIRIFQVVSRDRHIDFVPRSFGSAVDSKMFGRRYSFEILRIISLQASDECQSHAGCQIRIFAVGLLSATPSGIAKNVDVGRPYRQPLVPSGRTVRLLVGVVLGSELRADGVGITKNQFIVERCGQANGLRENRCDPSASNPMQSFVPPVVFWDTQSLDCIGSVPEL